MKVVVTVLTATFVMSMSLVALADCGCCEGDQELAELMKKNKELREDINLLNLINGMNFSTHQILHIIDCAKKADGLRNKVQVEVDIKAAEELKKRLEEIVTLMENNQEVPQELLQRAHQLRTQFDSKKHAKMGKRLPQMGELADKIQEILFDSQREILIDYNPCLIPPKNLKNPVLVGQASDSSHVVKILQRIRGLPDEVYDKRKDAIVDRLLCEAEKHVKLSNEEKVKARDTVTAIIEEARSMDDVDFELNKEELARKADVLNKIEVLKEELKELEGSENILKQKIIANLLNPKIIPLLEIRYKQLKEYQGEKPVDINSISPAESCKRGGCAIKD